MKLKTICKNKVEGGFRVKDITSFNITILGKWNWGLGTKENDLWKEIIVSKHG